MLIATTIGAWLLAGEVLGRRRLPQLVSAGVVGLWPMLTFLATSVNPDSLVNAASTFVLWLGARVINRRAQTRDAVALCAVTAVAILAKYTSYALVPAVLVALTIGWLRRPTEERATVAWRLGGALAALVIPVGIWLGLSRALGRVAVNQISTTSSQSHPVSVGQFLSYVWQFYLPRLRFMTRFKDSSGWPAYNYSGKADRWQLRMADRIPAELDLRHRRGGRGCSRGRGDLDPGSDQGPAAAGAAAVLRSRGGHGRRTRACR